jgi:hypothetical protein
VLQESIAYWKCCGTPAASVWYDRLLPYAAYGTALIALGALLTAIVAIVIRLMNADFVDRINAAVSRSLSRDHRDDVIADMVEAVLTENLKPEDIERRVSEFVRARFRLDHNCYEDLSLDMPAFFEGEMSLIGTISRGLWQ